MGYITDVNLAMEKLKLLTPSHLAFITSQIDTLLKIQEHYENHVNGKDKS